MQSQVLIFGSNISHFHASSCIYIEGHWNTAS